MYLLYVYDGVMVMLNVMKKVDLIDLVKYLLVFVKIDMVGVMLMYVVYDVKGDLKNGGIMMYKVEKGEWKLLKSIGGK